MEADEERLVELTRQIYRLYHSDVDVETAGESMRRQNISAGLVKSIYVELSKEAEKLMADRFYYYSIKDGIYGSFEDIKFWTSRYLFVYDTTSYNSTFYLITIFDLFNNKSIKFNIEKSARLFGGIYNLKDGFGLLKEIGNGRSFITLVFLDLRRRTLKKFHTVEFDIYLDILVNNADPTTFILEDLNEDKEFSRICKIVDNTIIIENMVEIDFFTESFYDKSVYGLKRRDENFQHINIPKISIYNVEEKTENQFDLELPAGYTFNSDKRHRWVRDIPFLQMDDRNKTPVIGYYNVQTRKWNILDFSPRLLVDSIYGFEEGNLIIDIERNDLKKYQFYRIPFGKPDSLENTAWLSLVKAMKKRETIKDPYEAARKCLPPNSAINSPFDNTDKDEPKNKRRKLSV